MLLENISLVNFKNYISLDIKFSPEVNCFVGNNGAGKTNLLDAIHYLSLTKSAFNSIDHQNITHTKAFFSIRGSFSKMQENYLVHCALKNGQKKIVKKNKSTYTKITEHIGEFPIVLITPYDTDLIREGSEVRRKFFDGILSQLSQPYLQMFLKYNHFLKQRNSLLKQFAERNYFDREMLESYDTQILSLGKALFEARKDLIQLIKPAFTDHFNFISSHKETIDLVYSSDLFVDNFEQKFKDALKKDLLLQRTSLGIHRDEYGFSIAGNPIKKFGSQGQQKSYIIALKLAQFDLLRDKKGFKPLLLLDDIFDKLDEQRIHKLLKMVAGNAFGQIFITDARPERSTAIFKEINADVKIFVVEKGEVVQIDTNI